jgi:hypothetical protein
MMSTHIATLATFALGKTPPVSDPEYLPVVHSVMANLDQAMNGLKTVKDNIPVSLNVSVENNADNISPGISGEAKKLSGENTDRVINPTIDQEKATLEGSFARNGLRQLNERIAEMVSIRKKEVEQGITKTQLRTSLAVLKSINDQFNFIWKISEDLLKTLRA